MKTSNLNTTSDTFNEYAISNEEMIHIRGGEGDIIIKPSTPPVII